MVMKVIDECYAHLSTFGLTKEQQSVNTTMVKAKALKQLSKSIKVGSRQNFELP